MRERKKTAQLAVDRKARGRAVDLPDTFIARIVIALGATLAKWNAKLFEESTDLGPEPLVRVSLRDAISARLATGAGVEQQPRSGSRHRRAANAFENESVSVFLTGAV